MNHLKFIVPSILVFFVVTIFCCCASAEKTFPTTTRNGKVIVNKNVDLQGKTIKLPSGCTLVFKNGSIIKNGTLVGNDTRVFYKGYCFDNIIIKGTWIVPVIRSDMFLSYETTNLSNLFALQNGTIKNTIYIAPGKYFVNSNENRWAISVSSNTTLIIDGDIVLDSQTNKQFYNGYYIFFLNNTQNVSISGNGTLLGDYGKSGLESEFGHGICVYNSSNVSINGLKIKDVQGDGIAISIGNSNVSVEGVEIEHYYRNGISIVDGNNYVISNVVVKNGGETSPYAAIDIEPNEGYRINNVQIRNLTIDNCAVGISGYVPNKASVDNVRYQSVRMSGVTRCCLSSSLFKSLELDDVYIEKIGEKAEIMRLLENQFLSLTKVRVEAGNNKAKYPFYLNNKNMQFVDCCFDSPQLFTWHLSNANFKNCSFKFDSFIWTALDLSNNNIIFDHCAFNGPLFMRPRNVKFYNSVFKNTHSKQRFLVRFEDSNITNEDYSGVTLDNSTFELENDMTEISAVQCFTKKKTVVKSVFIKE